MFTGLITAVGTVRAVRPIGAGQAMRLIIAAPWPDVSAIPIGASIACSGCCLTAVAAGAESFDVEVSAETLARTTLGRWREGTKVNLERSLRVGEELGGHLVSGHVDGVGEGVSVTPDSGSQRWVFRTTPDLVRFIAVKGSIAVDGVSVTVNEVSRDTFGINVIPHTAEATTFSMLRPGDLVNIEIDMLARYVARLSEARV